MPSAADKDGLEQALPFKKPIDHSHTQDEVSMSTVLRYQKGYQFFDGNGKPLALGNLYYYIAGTTTPQNTYSDSAGAVPNTNPIVLDGSGRLDVDVYLGSASNYKEVLTTSNVTVSPWPDDNRGLHGRHRFRWNFGPCPRSGRGQRACQYVSERVRSLGDAAHVWNQREPHNKCRDCLWNDSCLRIGSGLDWRRNACHGYHDSRRYSGWNDGCFQNVDDNHAFGRRHRKRRVER